MMETAEQQLQTYTVQAPDGKQITLQGPQGASDDEVTAQAQKLYTPAATPNITDPIDPTTGTRSAPVQGPNPISDVFSSVPAQLKNSTAGVMYGQAKRLGQGMLDTAKTVGTALGLTPNDRINPGEYNPTQILNPGQWDAIKSLVKGFVTPANKYLLRDPDSGLVERVYNTVIAMAGGDPDAAKQYAAMGQAEKSLAADFTGPILSLGLGHVLKQIPGMEDQVKPIVPTDKNIQAFGDIVAGGVRKGSGETPQSVAATTWPLREQAVSELSDENGKDMSQFPQRRAIGERSYPSSLQTAAEQAMPIADRMVEISERPLNAALNNYGSIKVPQVQQSIVSELLAKAAEYDNKDASVASAIRGVANDVQARGGTVSGLNDLKAHANKELNSLSNASVGQQIAASAQSAYAYRIAADSIRKNLYPAITDFGGPDLSAFGKREASAIQARDGIYGSYYENAAPAQASRLSKSYLEYLSEGSLFEHKILAKAGGLYKTPLGSFNERFGNGLGSSAKNGMTPESVSSTPTTYEMEAAKKMLPPPPGAQPGFAFTIQGEPVVQTLSQMKMVDLPKTYAGTREVPNPNYTPMTEAAEPNSYTFGKTPAAQRAEQLGSSADSTPTRSITGQPTTTESNWQVIQHAETDPLRKGAGPGALMTNDPKLVERTISSIQEQLKNNPPPQLKRQLLEVQTNLVGQLEEYRKNANIRPNIKVNPGQVTVTPSTPGTQTSTTRSLRYGVPLSLTAPMNKPQP